MTCFTYSSVEVLRDSQKMMIDIWRWTLNQLKFSSRMKRYLVLRLIYLLQALLSRAELNNQELLGLRLKGTSVKVWSLPKNVKNPKKYLEVLRDTRKLVLDTAIFSVYEIYRNMSEIQEQGDTIVVFASRIFAILVVRLECVFEHVFDELSEEGKEKREHNKKINKPLTNILKSATPDVPSPLYIRKQNSFMDILDDVEDQVDDGGGGGDDDDDNDRFSRRVVTDVSVNILEWRSVENLLKNVYGDSDSDLERLMSLRSKWSRLFRRKTSQDDSTLLSSSQTSFSLHQLDGVCLDLFVVEWLKQLIRTIGLFRRSGFGRGNLPWYV